MATAPLPKTWSVNDPLDASTLNTQLKTILDFLQSPPSCELTHSLTQALANSTGVTLAFNSELTDTDGMHSTTVNTMRITCQTDGRYLVTYNIAFASNTTGIRRVTPQLSGVSYPQGQAQVAAANGGSTAVTCSFVISMSTGQYLTLEALQTSGGTLDVNANASFTATWISL